MNDTYLLSGDIGGGYWPGLIVPAAVLLVALVSAAVVLYMTYIRPSGGPGGSDEK
jgi:hypothetical protein